MLAATNFVLGWTVARPPSASVTGLGANPAVFSMKRAER
jgi:hypothetical protein